jgi:hypothetical protein
MPSAQSGSSTLVGFSSDIARRRLGYGVTSALLLLVVIGIGVVVPLAGGAGFGVESGTVRATAGDLRLEVTYGLVSRPALATPFDVTVTREGGFDEPVRLAIDRQYLRLWDENGLYPEPSAETVLGPWLILEFDPPTGTSLQVSYDGRIEPAAQAGRRGAVAVLAADDSIVAEVTFTTRIWP